MRWSRPNLSSDACVSQGSPDPAPCQQCTCTAGNGNTEKHPGDPDTPGRGAIEETRYQEDENSGRDRKTDDEAGQLILLRHFALISSCSNARCSSYSRALEDFFNLPARRSVVFSEGSTDSDFGGTLDEVELAE